MCGRSRNGRDRRNAATHEGVVARRNERGAGSDHRSEPRLPCRYRDRLSPVGDVLDALVELMLRLAGTGDESEEREQRRQAHAHSREEARQPGGGVADGPAAALEGKVAGNATYLLAVA